MHTSVSSTTTSSKSSSALYTKLRSVFVCSLPNAPYLCQCSQQLDKKEEQDGNGLVHRNPSGTTPWYDQLVINAAKYGFINITKYPKSRQIIIQLAKEYHQSLLLQSSSNNKPNNDQSSLPSSGIHNINGPPRSTRSDDDDGYEFPLQCPTVMELTEFLQQSLRYEEMIVPDYYLVNKQDHIDQFWNRVRDPYKDYCIIDPIRTLRQRHWQHFFLSILPTQLEQTKIVTTG